MKTTALFLVLMSTISTSDAHFKDLGFRYKDGKCVNAKGEEGLNPSLPGQCADFRGSLANRLDWSGMDFSGSRFDNADLQNMGFQDSIFVDVIFDGADLSGSNLQNAKFQRVQFQNTTLLNVKWAEAEFQAAGFDGAKLTGADFTFGLFSKSHFKGTHLESANLEEAKFIDCDLSGAFLKGANLKNASMIRAKLSGTDLSTAILTKADLSMATADSAGFYRASLNGAHLGGANFEGSDLRTADLQDAETTSAILKNAKFNKKTVLPFSQDDAKAKGMLFQKTAVIFMWTNSIYPVEVNNLLKVIPQIHDDFEIKSYNGVNMTEFEAFLKESSIFVLPYQGSPPLPFVKTVGPALLAFATAGGTIISVGNDQTVITVANVHSRPRSGAFGQSRLPVLIPTHPLAEGFEATVQTTQNTIYFRPAAGEGVDVIGTAERPIVNWKPIGTGQVIRIGYDYEFESMNPDAIRVLKNAFAMAN